MDYSKGVWDRILQLAEGGRDSKTEGGKNDARERILILIMRELPQKNAQKILSEFGYIRQGEDL